MRILITGIGGFVGNILHSMLRDMNYEVYGIDFFSTDKNIVKINITDPVAIQDAMIKISPDFILHLAAISRVDLNEPQNIFNVNVNGTLNLLSACLKLREKPKIIVVSSSQVYGIPENNTQSLNENADIKPVNLYGASKAAAENIAMAFYNEFDLPVVIARPFNHTGKGQSEHFIIPKLIQAYKKKQKKLTIGNTDISRDYLDVRDVVNAYIKIMQNFHPGEVYNISSGESISLSDIISIIENLSDHKLNIVPDKELFRKNEIVNIRGDSSKIIKETGWEPKYDINETLRWMLE